jgi:hypothetical protein
MEFIGAHGGLEFRGLNGLPDECIRIQKDIIIEEDVVDADDAFIPELNIIDERGTGMQVQVQTEMQIMVEVCACGDDPIDVTALNEGDDGASAQSGGVRAPVRLMPTNPFPGSILRLTNWQPSLNLPAL